MPNEHMAVQVCNFLFIPLKSAVIVTYDEETELQTDEDWSIAVIPIWKWLLLNE